FYLSELQTAYCDDGSGWACNELGNLQLALGGDRAGALASLERGCRLGFQSACANADEVRRGGNTMARAAPALADYAIVLRAGKAPITDRAPASLYARACDQGWPDTCAGVRESR